MDTFFKEKEIEIKKLLEKEFKGKEFRLEDCGQGDFVIHVTDMYFFEGQWRRLYVNRLIHLQKESGPLACSIDSHVNKETIAHSINVIHRQMDGLLRELGYE